MHIHFGCWIQYQSKSILVENRICWRVYLLQLQSVTGSCPLGVAIRFIWHTTKYLLQHTRGEALLHWSSFDCGPRFGASVLSGSDMFSFQLWAAQHWYHRETLGFRGWTTRRSSSATIPVNPGPWCAEEQTGSGKCGIAPMANRMVSIYCIPFPPSNSNRVPPGPRHASLVCTLGVKPRCLVIIKNVESERGLWNQFNNSGLVGGALIRGLNASSLPGTPHLSWAH